MCSADVGLDGARSVVCPWGFREFGLGGEERAGGRGGGVGAAWSDVVARLLACRRRYVDDGLVRPSVALVDLGVGWGLYDDASPKALRAVVRSGPALHDVPSNTSVELRKVKPSSPAPTPPTAYRRPSYDASLK